MGRLRRERKKAERRDKRDRRKSGRAKKTLSESGAARRKSKSQTRTQRKSSSKPSLKLPTPDTRKPFPLGETKPAPKPTNEQAQADVADVKNRIAEQDIEVEKAQARVDNQRAIDERNARYNQQVALDEATIEQPGGWKNLTDVDKIATTDTLKAFGEGALLGAEIGLTVVTAGALIKGAVLAIKALKGTSTIAKLAQVGTLIPNDRKLTIAKSIAVNSATTKATASWLSKLVKSANKSPLAAVGTSAAIVGGIMSAIGTYPFANFEKGEALDRLDYGIGAAEKIGDFEGAQEAIDLKRQILDPGLWDRITAKIPFVNVHAAVNDFFHAARIKLSIDEKVFADKKFQLEHGETDTEKWARIDQERRDTKLKQTEEDDAHYANLEKLRREAKVLNRNEDAKVFQDAIDKRRETDLANRKADADYWTLYYKEVAKQRANSQPSNLKFGLL